MSETSNPATKSTAASSSAADLLEQLQSQLAAPLFTAVSDRLSHFQNTVVAYENKLQYAELKIRMLEERLRLQRIAKYGPGSEKLSDAQLELLEVEPGVSNFEVEAESKRTPLAAKAARQHPGRQTLPGDLPRVERIISCPPEQCFCGSCGQSHGGDRLKIPVRDYLRAVLPGLADVSIRHLAAFTPSAWAAQHR